MAKQAANTVVTNAGSAVEGVSEVAKQAANTVVTNAGSAVEGVSEVAKQAANTVVTNAMYAGSVVNSKIDENPTLSNMKRQTTQKMGEAAAYVGYLVGWNSANEEIEEEFNHEGEP